MNRVDTSVFDRIRFDNEILLHDAKEVDLDEMPDIPAVGDVNQSKPHNYATSDPTKDFRRSTHLLIKNDIVIERASVIELEGKKKEIFSIW